MNLSLVDVDLGQHDALVGIVGGDLVEHRAKLLARPAPFGPEIEDDEAGHRRLDDVALEPLDRLPLVLAHAQSRHALLLAVDGPPYGDDGQWAASAGLEGGCGASGGDARRPLHPTGTSFRSANRAGVAQG